MIRRRSYTFLSLLLICFGGVTGLRHVRLFVEPKIVLNGSSASLFCLRDMEGAPLYSVKWYRGTHEFYRYTPVSDPPIMVFELPATIHVDKNRSNGSQVVLKKLDMSLSGPFSCEVTADAPLFSTYTATKYIDILSLPANKTVLIAERDSYQPGDILRANCTSPPAKPAANLTIYINGEPIRSSETRLLPSEQGLIGATITAEVEISLQQFVGGRIRVACIASIYDVYNDSAILDFFTPEADPRPERITHSNAPRSFQCWFLLFLLMLLPMLTMGEDYYSNEDDSYDGVQYYNDENEKRLLIGLIRG